MSDERSRDAAPQADNGVTRRRALQILGAVPVAAALGQQAGSPQTPPQQQKPLTPGVTSQVPTGPAATTRARYAEREVLHRARMAHGQPARRLHHSA